VIKYPVKVLKKGDRSLIMFPTGSRYSNDLIGGVALIAKMSKAKIQPVVYQGPLTMSGIFLRQRVDVNYGDLIDVSDITKMDEAGIKEVERRIQTAFDALDKELNPNYVYVPHMSKKKKEQLLLAEQAESKSGTEVGDLQKEKTKEEV
jgi:1-acyl-sn-glycerol-3-phosphate acyltransferase